MTFEERIKQLMAEKNMTQKELSIKSGITTPSLCRYLKGSSQPRKDILINLAKALGVEVSYLIGDEPSKKDAKTETINVVARNRSALSDTDKAEIIKILLGGK